LSGFLYFIADMMDAPEPDKLKAAGIAHAFENSPAYRAIGGSGPSGGGGMLLGTEHTAMGETIGYYPQRQTWRQHPLFPPTWLGLYNEAKPSPDDLVRKEQGRGYRIRMGDEQDWLIPTALKFMEQGDGGGYVNILPHRMALDEQGRFARTTVQERYAGLADKAQAFFDWYVGIVSGGDEKITVEDADIAALVVEALSINYRVGSVEIDTLGLLTEQTIMQAGRAVIDWPFYVEHCKKKMTAAST
jgi:hypothetical protein